MTEKLRIAKFSNRLGAYLLDAILVGGISYGLNYLNFISIKSFYAYLPLALIAILYKPYMESRHQATIGKMAINLKVTDINHKRIDFSTSRLRSLIVIIPSLLIIPVQFMAYSNPDLMNLEGFWTHTKGVAETYPNLTTFNSFYSTIFIVNLIMLLADGTKQNRSLKDRIAKTLVLKT